MKFNEQAPSPAPVYGKRSSDRDSKAVVHDAEDALVLLEAYRKKEITADSVGGTVPMEIIFAWLSEKKISATEFEELLWERVEHETVIIESRPWEAFEDEPSDAEKAKIVREKLASYPEKYVSDILDAALVREYCDSYEKSESGLWAVLLFEKTEADEEGPAISFSAEMRFLKIAPDGRDSARAEIVFETFDGEECLIYSIAEVPLPLTARGRRKLFMTVTGAETRSPLKIPPNVAMAFREKFLTKIEIRLSAKKTWWLMGAISKRVWRMIGG